MVSITFAPSPELLTRVNISSDGIVEVAEIEPGSKAVSQFLFTVTKDAIEICGNQDRQVSVYPGGLDG